jgi:hypothetical protein
VIWLAIGYNDVSRVLWPDAPTFGAAYGTLLDAIHTADPGATVFAASMLHSDIDGNLYAPQILSAAAARPSFCTGVDGLTLMASSGLSGGDGVHPVNVGHQAVALGTGGSAGSTSIRAVLGI